MSNRLAQEKSPYLLQHAENPVDWYPWSQEALARARAENRPILVSIGYSACHWCHVMAHESFEDDATAGLMNEYFVNIKVDREERPDVDALYMEAVQAMTGQGGWPLNVFLTPDGRPFFGGTYFPPEPRHGMPSWRQVLEQVAAAFKARASDVERNAETLTDYVRKMQHLGGSGRGADAAAVAGAYRIIVGGFDREEGGFGGAPKFPQPLLLDFLLQVAVRRADDSVLDLVFLTLDRMASRGIYDQLGGGFHRYAVDGRWVVPHFEKMLYDNALLARVYLHAFQISHRPEYRQVVEETLDYLLRDLASPEGGFFSAQDADSEGVEGKFYVWTPDEVASILPPRVAEAAMLYYGIGPEGNFEGQTILTRAAGNGEVAASMGVTPEEVSMLLAEARRTLLSARAQRVPPGTDTKILTAWNALVVRALAESGSALQRDDYLAAAQHCARFLLSALRPAGRLVRSYRDGPSRIPAYLEDYAYLAEALITLYESTADLEYLDRAKELTDDAIERFWDDADGLFFDAVSSPDLIARPRSIFDNPIPSGTSSATLALLRLAALTGSGPYEEIAARALQIDSELLLRAAPSVAYLLSALDFLQQGAVQVAIVPGESGQTEELARVVYERYLPTRVMAIGAGDWPALLSGRGPVDGAPAAYVCRRFSCDLPVTEPGALAQQLTSAR